MTEAGEEAGAGGERREWTVPAGGAERLDRALARAFPDLSRARLQALIAEGRVTVDGAPARASAKPPPGARVEVVVPPPTPTALLPEDIPLDVLYEDDDLAVLCKPAGMVVHPAAGHARGTLVHALLGRWGRLSTVGGVERPGIVHRLDVGTSGVMVVARTDAAHRGLSAAFAAHDIDRRYLAVVHRTPLHDAGTIESRLARDPKNRLRMASVPEREDLEAEETGWEDDDDLVEGPAERPRLGRRAVTHWRVRARADRLALLEVRLETGRTHQVRVHLSEAGHPLVGDAVYARRDCVAPAAVRALAEALDHPLLHAYRLGFTHPVDGRELWFEAPPPADFVAFCRAAGLALA